MIEMERASGQRHLLRADRWAAPSTVVERALLRELRPAVLDVGCGPGRIAAALAESGVPSLGIDVSPSALAMASRSGATVLQRSVFDLLPGEGRWATVLLLDGNVGIGGDPERLLRRVRELCARDGRAVVEVEPPGSAVVADRVRLRRPGDGPGPWFDWAWVGADGIGQLARSAGFGECDVSSRGGRHFASLTGSAAREEPDAARRRRTVHSRRLDRSSL